MCIFVASSLAWIPALVAPDHPDDDHLHVVCAVDESASAADVSVYRVLRPLIFRHDRQALKLCVGEHAQLLLSDELGYECEMWAKVVIKKVWPEGYAVVTICSEFRDVIAQKVSVAFKINAFFAFNRHFRSISCAATPWSPCTTTYHSHLWCRVSSRRFVDQDFALLVAGEGACLHRRALMAGLATSLQTRLI
jgi:hypothetical protein